MKGFSKNLSKIVILILAIMMCVPSIACNENSAKATADDVQFWSTYATEKVTRDNVGTFNDIMFAPEIELTAVKGEIESAQIIMTTGNKAVEYYDAKVTNLTSSTGAVFSSENIDILYQKYVLMEGPSDYYLQPGYYPDCLVPLEGVVYREENYIEKNSNQGLYIDFDIPQLQETGTYTGTLVIEINDNSSKNIPITLNVGYSNITEETHVMSEFSTKWYPERGEVDYTQEMFDAYNYAMFEHRLGINEVAYRSSYYTTDEDILFYARKAIEYASDPRCPNFLIPRGGARIQAGDRFSEEICYPDGKYYHLWSPSADYMSVERFARFLRIMAYEALEAKVDVFAKSFSLSVDEPDLRGLTNMTPIIAYLFKSTKDMVIEELKNDKSITDQAFLAVLLDSLEGLHCVCTSSTYISYEFDYDTEDFVYCPEYDWLNNEYNLERYRIDERNDLWWYGTVNPDPPYPTYHLDDHLLSARLLGWMQRDYNIQGNLYWAVNNYSNGANGPYSYGYMENYYEDGVYSLGTYGDGQLVYPGKKYGVFGPLSSLRMHAIRDGQEEHEFWYYLQEKYAELSKKAGITLSESEIMDNVTNTLYNGTQVQTTNEAFVVGRDKLISLLDLANAGVAISSVHEVAGKYEVKLFALDGVTLNYTGNYLVKGSQEMGEGTLYTIEVSPGAPFKLGTSIGDYDISFAIDVGSSSDIYDAKYIHDNNMVRRRTKEDGSIYKGNNDVSVNLVDATTVNPEAMEGEQYLQLVLSDEGRGKKEDYPLGFELVNDGLFGKIGTQTDKLTIGLYNSGDKDLYVYVYVLYEYDTVMVQYMRDVMKPGANYYSMNNLWAANWDKFKGIRKLYVRIYETDEFGNVVASPGRDDVYFTNISIYNR